jgi:hypothetical protein
MLSRPGARRKFRLVSPRLPATGHAFCLRHCVATTSRPVIMQQALCTR